MALSEAELQALIDQTERTLLGLPEPGNIDALKVAPDYALNPVRKADQKALRMFILANNRAPNEDELRKMTRWL